VETVSDLLTPPPNARDLFHWREEIVSPELRSVWAVKEELVELVKVPAHGIRTVPLLAPEFCRALIWLSNTIGQFRPDPSDPYGGKELDTSLIAPLHENVITEVFNRYMVPLVELCFDGYSVNRITGAFVLKYSMGTQQSMGLHFDDSSDVSLTIVLNDGFEGGGLSFPRYEWSSAGLPVGSAVLFPGRVTHRHEGLPITSGERYALIMWLQGRDD
jgi:hypothetical protein